MGLDPMRARGSLRFSLGIYNDEKDVDYVLMHLPKIIVHLRANSPLALSPAQDGKLRDDNEWRDLRAGNNQVKFWQSRRFERGVIF
jgi:hypothetical protein